MQRRPGAGVTGHSLVEMVVQSLFPKNFLKTDLFFWRGEAPWLLSPNVSWAPPDAAMKEWQRGLGITGAASCSPMYRVTEYLLPIPRRSLDIDKGVIFWYVAERERALCRSTISTAKYHHGQTRQAAIFVSDLN